jgi:hypothetical protein
VRTQRFVPLAIQADRHDLANDYKRAMSVIAVYEGVEGLKLLKQRIGAMHRYGDLDSLLIDLDTLTAQISRDLPKGAFVRTD